MPPGGGPFSLHFQTVDARREVVTKSGRMMPEQSGGPETDVASSRPVHSEAVLPLLLRPTQEG